MNDEQKKRDELRLNFHLYKNNIPGDLRETMEKFFSIADEIENRKKFSAEAMPLLFELMLKQYPDFKNITSPVQLEWMNEYSVVFSEKLHAHSTQILKDGLNKVDVLQKYPRLEEWRAYYVKKREPRYITDADTNNYYYNSMGKEEREKHIASENRELKIFHDWEEKRKNEYYEIMQPLLFRHLHLLNELEGDWWVIYAVGIRDNYEQWKTLCEELETSLDYNLPPESCRWDYDKFIEAVKKGTPEQFKAAQQRREERIHSGI